MVDILHDVTLEEIQIDVNSEAMKFAIKRVDNVKNNEKVNQPPGQLKSEHGSASHTGIVMMTLQCVSKPLCQN